MKDGVWGGLMIAFLFVAATLANAFVLMQLWGWFIAPLGVIEIGMAHAWGISALVHMLTDHNCKTDIEGGFWVAIVKTVFAPIVVLLLGYIAFAIM